MNPADINAIQGTYPAKPTLPGTPGHEGVGKIIQVGGNVKNLAVGDLVIPNSDNFGTWRTHNVVKADILYKVIEIFLILIIVSLITNFFTFSY